MAPLCLTEELLAKRRSRWRAAAMSAALALGYATVSAAPASGTASHGTSSSTYAPFLPTPLATSVGTSEGTWATVPMGRLDQPVNTFWQLFSRPTGKELWSNEVEVTATATNGGLVLASSGGRSLTVGVRPSVRLTFTPLISTSDNGRTWSNGLITGALADRPYALATGTAGQALALDQAHGTTEVLESRGDFSTWRTLADERTLARAAARCGLAALSAVGYGAGQPLVAGTCAHPGVVGLLERHNGSWQLAGPALPSPMRAGRVEVLALVTGPRGTRCLLDVSLRARSDLLAASGMRGKWATSAPLPVAASETVASFGPADGGAFFVLLNSPSRHSTLVTGGPGQAWRELPSPPPGTETVAFAPSYPVNALVMSSSTLLSVWSLVPGTGKWARSQLVHVPVQFGSSSFGFVS